jgi:PAS domain S-box-containing protein
MFENSVQGIYRSTSDGRYLDVNPALAKMYGYDNPGQLLNQVSDISHQIYVNPAYRDIFKDEINKSGIVRGLEYEVRRRDGATIWISESARVVRNAKGEIRYFEGFIEDITPRKEAERKLHISQQQLLETSRQVGMAEVATSILHNMGNALNSINTSVYVAADLVKKSKTTAVGKAAGLLHSHSADLAAFLTVDPKGKKLPDFLTQLADHLAREQEGLLRELDTLSKSLEHVNEIVAMQQNYAKASAMTETVNPIDLMEDALRMNGNSLARHGVVVVREYDHDLPKATVSKHKVLQILMNLVRNAQKACDGREGGKQIILRAGSFDSGKWVRMEVLDNGVGIDPSNLTRLFTHGFTTRKDGHGFGLHSGALMAKELGGHLSAKSSGPGQGATFTLEFPILPPEPEADVAKK